ncbi:MAG: pentapeptide repeat-containing protein [Crocosphaera sp.]|nr:pentapeptide repeat-containing protein [Crocosphaera sp.]
MNWFKDRINNFRLTVSQDNHSLEQEIEKKADELWEQGGKLENTLDYYREKARQQVKHNLWKKHYNPYYLLEKKILEPGLSWIDKQALFDIIGRLGNLAIVIGVISFIVTEDYRRNEALFSAWQTITSAENQSSDGGRIQALEFLNSRPVRFPFIGLSKPLHLHQYGDEQPEWYWAEWYWDSWTQKCKEKGRFFGYLWGRRWPRQRLSRLYAPNAYLNGIKLCGASLWGVNLEGAFLNKAQLQEVNLVEADLSKAKLNNANLQGASLLAAQLQGASLIGANLIGANLQESTLIKDDLVIIVTEAAYSDSETNPSFCPSGYSYCPTIFPDGFDPEKAGMILIRTQEDYDKW